MQFPKFMSLVCAAAVCTGLFSARASDTPAQAAARAALMEKLNEQNAQQPATNAKAPSVAFVPFGAKQEQQNLPSSVTIAPKSAQTQPAATSVDNEAQARALKALQQKMSELDKQSAVGTPAQTQPAAISVDNESQAMALKALQQKMSELDKQSAAESKSAISESPAQVAARTALTAKMSELDAQQASANAATTTPAHPSNVNYPGKDLGFKPILPPPPPVSADKEAQLRALLEIYMADKISPGEYQKQRAAILSAP